MTRAAEHPSPEANATLFAQLADAHLWTLTVGPPPDSERLTAQARLSGFAKMSFRAGRSIEGERFFPAATTSARLRQSGLDQPGDSMTRLPFRLVAHAARESGLAIAINPGGGPFGHLAPPAVATFADGGIPSAMAPDREATVSLAAREPIAPLATDALPVGLLEAATNAGRAEPDIAAASLVVRPFGEGREFGFLAVLRRPVDEEALTRRLAGQLVGLIGPENYLTVEYVREDDPRLSDLEHATLLAPV